MRAEIAELFNSFDVKFGRLFIQPPPRSMLLICYGSVIQADTIIGKHVLVNTAAAMTMRM
jgi:hypothetical protein